MGCCSLLLVKSIPVSSTTEHRFQNLLSKHHPIAGSRTCSDRRTSRSNCRSLLSDDASTIATKYKWIDTNPNRLSDERQIEAISRLPYKMTNRCKALMKQIICSSPENSASSVVPLMLTAWVKSAKPRRSDWLMVLKELSRMNHPLYLEVAEHALSEETFEAGVRDYTKLIHFYARRDQLREAERTLESMKSDGFVCDQVLLTSLLHMYSKNGNLRRAEAAFGEMKALGVPLDRRSYGAMAMAHVRAGKLSDGEALLREAEALEIYAGKEVYKALLRAYSMRGDSRGAQRIFDSMQVVGIVPDAKICGLLMNAFVESGETREARIAFGNMMRAGIEPNEKCVALVLSACRKEEKLSEALDLLVRLEGDGFGLAIGEEASNLLAKWFREMGVLKEVEHVLSESLRHPFESSPEDVFGLPIGEEASNSLAKWFRGRWEF
ncbi:hypothetical protein M569_09579 [Genlisea aurea]|uniref:Pentacotripeptide-repeat region of PRORP domain-containing protein n=1 Tax=Genlisea aurea TaxID=192259 RepID=S8DQ08_9LAMI|nr:hypothetical protein M569_09579 [Genlisea aurea]